VARQLKPKSLQRKTAGDRVAASGSVLGIDPGLNRTGYAVLRAADQRVLDAGLIRSSARASLPVRLREIAAGIDEVLAEFQPTRVAVEDLYSHYAHPRTAILMGHVRGAIFLCAARAGVEVLSLPATRIKKTLTGNGHAGKLQVQRAVQATLRLPQLPRPSDVADAIAIAWCAALDGRRTARWPRPGGPASGRKVGAT